MTKTKCKANIRVVLQLDRKWLVSYIVLEYNHELSTMRKEKYHKTKRKLCEKKIGSECWSWNSTE